MKKVLFPSRLWLSVILIIMFCLQTFAFGQGSSGNSAKKSKPESCDGALDIVPAKAMTFARKRRPSAVEPKTPSASTAAGDARETKPGKN
jgi:hypothetical protein